jgi:hypothetical protein
MLLFAFSALEKFKQHLCAALEAMFKPSLDLSSFHKQFTEPGFMFAG